MAILGRVGVMSAAAKGLQHGERWARIAPAGTDLSPLANARKTRELWQTRCNCVLQPTD